MKYLIDLTRFFLVLICISWLPNLYAESKKEIIFATAVPIDNSLFKLGEKVLGVISDRMGEKIKLISIPGKRSAMLLKSNEIHAELARSDEYSQRVPFAIKVPEPIIEITQHAYSINHNFQVDGWESLKPYRLVSMRGSWVVEVHMTDHDISMVDSMRSAFKFLKSGRADVCIASSILAQRFLNSTKLDVSNIIRLEPAVHTSKDYTFFAAGYPELASKYERALKSIKADGTYKKMLSNVSMQ